MSFYYSIWWLIPIIIVSFLLTYLLYRKDISSKNKLQKKIYPLFLLRFLALVSIGILLLQIQTKAKQKEKIHPHLFILQDNSRSILAHKDSLNLKNQLHQSYQSLFSTLEKENIPYKLGLFSDSLQYFSSQDFLSNLDFKGVSTNISQALKQIQNDFLSDDIGGALLLSDGIHNLGTDPLIASANWAFPVYTIALGDSNIYPDVQIEQVRIKKYAYNDRLLPFQLFLKAVNMPEKKALLNIKIDGKLAEQKPIVFEDMPGTLHLESHLPKLKAGIHKIDFKIETSEQERNLNNNTRSVFVELVDDKQKVALIYHSPHPDISALKTALSNYPSFDLDLINIKDIKSDNIKAYSLLILHQIPHLKENNNSLLQAIQQEHKPVWFINSNTSDLKQLEKFTENTLQFNRLSNQNEWFKTSYQSDFTPFLLEPAVADWLAQTPPLVGASFRLLNKNKIDILLKEQINGLETERPALFFQDNKGSKSAFLMGEGLWKWRMQAYRQHEDFAFFDNFIQKIVQYLSSSKPKEHLVLDYNKQSDVNQAMQINAQLLNDAYESVYGATLTMRYWMQDSTKVQEVLFENTEQDSLKNKDLQISYHLNLGYLKSGKYHFEVSGEQANKTFTKKGLFIIKPSFKEWNNTRALPQIMRQIAQETNGESLKLDQISSLISKIKQQPSFKARMYSQTIEKPLINQWVLLLIIVCLLVSEWFLRKKIGKV